MLRHSLNQKNCKHDDYRWYRWKLEIVHVRVWYGIGVSRDCIGGSRDATITSH